MDYGETDLQSEVTPTSNSSVLRLQRWGFVIGCIAIVAIHLAGRIGSYCSPIRGDSYYYGAIGYRIAGGEAMYREVSDVKPPAVYWLYAASYTFLPIGRLSMAPVESLFAAAGYLAVFLLARNLYGAGIGMILTVTLTLATNTFSVLDYATEGFGLAEGFMIFPAAMAVIAYRQATQHNAMSRFILCGAWLGLELMLKQTALPLVIAILLHSVIVNRHHGLSAIVRALLSIGTGITLAIAPFALAVLYQGTWQRAFEVLGPGAIRMTSMETAFPAHLKDVLPLWVPLAWSATGIFMWATMQHNRHPVPTRHRQPVPRRDLPRRDLGLLILWIALECVMLAILPLRSYHYYVIACLPVILLSGAFWANLMLGLDGSTHKHARVQIAVAAVLSLAVVRTTVDATVPIAWSRYRSYDADADRAYFEQVVAMDLAHLGEKTAGDAQ